MTILVKARVLAFACAPLAACTTMSGVMSKPPIFTDTSAFSTDALEECISKAISPFAQVAVIRGEGRRTITTGDRGATGMAVSIVDGNPVTIEGRSAYSSLLSGGKWRKRIDACAQTGRWN